MTWAAEHILSLPPPEAELVWGCSLPSSPFLIAPSPGRALSTSRLLFHVGDGGTSALKRLAQPESRWISGCPAGREGRVLSKGVLAGLRVASRVGM